MIKQFDISSMLNELMKIAQLAVAVAMHARPLHVVRCCH